MRHEARVHLHLALCSQLSASDLVFQSGGGFPSSRLLLIVHNLTL